MGKFFCIICYADCLRRRKDLFLGAASSNFLASASESFSGAVPLGMRAFFLPSVTYGPYGPLAILIPLGNSRMYLLASCSSLASYSLRASASLIVIGSYGLMLTNVLPTWI